LNRTSLAIVVLLALPLLLAGCGGKPAATRDERPGGSEYIGKTLYGAVLDDELYPIDGANVILDDVGINMTTGADGAFRFTGLEPIDYLVVAERVGHETRAARAAMVSGREFELNFTLPRLPTGEPRFTTSIFKGHIACHVAVKTDYPGWITQDCGSADPNNKRGGVFEFDAYASAFVVEFDWEPTQDCAKSLRTVMVLRVPEAESFPVVEQAIKPGERILLGNASLSLRQKTGGEVTVGLGADRCDNDYAGFALQQSVEVYLTAFYFMSVPDGFSALAT
jgi:hypothetical protein